ncbi:MAG: Ldh family oxidoreductase [Bacillota bacterium]|nr:Ldh family oxidoreductase [Bacillota bacterium]
MAGHAGGTVYRIEAEKLKEFCRSAFRRAGTSEEHAWLLADALVEADLRGVETHGCSRLGMYVERMGTGSINPRPRLRMVREHGATAVLDGDRAMGQLATWEAMGRAMDLAEIHGVGVVAVRDSGHAGALGYPAARALVRDMIGSVTTNTGPLMAPWGGARPVLGNNPFAMAIPSDAGFPVVLDTALSVVARGHIIMAARRGKPIPEGWAIDLEGRPTTDPEAALLGSVLPIAGYKGYGMALMLEILTGVLAGGTFGSDVGRFAGGDPRRPVDMSHLVVVLRVASLMDVAEFRARVARLLQQVKSSRRPDTAGEVLVPGERSWRKRERRLREGIPLEEATAVILRKVSCDLDLEPPALEPLS